MVFQRAYFLIFFATFIFAPACSTIGLKSDRHAKVMAYKRSSLSKKRNAGKIENNKKLAIKTQKQWSVLDLFRSEQKRMELRCPDDQKKKKRVKTGQIAAKEEIDTYEGKPDVMLATGFESIHFDIIKVSERRLEIPAFKQFKNNMTDFTADGEEEFKTILAKIRDFLGDNTDGHGVTLHIIGSASQIPTSFDPTKPNNNIQEDGSSIPGQTSIENNKTLAKARATELAKKIKAVFVNINIITPELHEIQLGETPWDWRAQKRLNDAVHSNNAEAIAKVYEPFQKEQFVKVESKETQAITVKPESIKMYTVNMSPSTYFKDHRVQTFIKEKFVISKETYDQLGQKTLFYESVDDRQQFLEDKGLEITYITKNGRKRWYLIHGDAEKETFSLQNDFERIHKQYTMGIVDNLDKKTLRKIITEKYLKLHEDVVAY